MYYVYVLRSETDKKFYIGCTRNLRNRVEVHNRGLVESTMKRLPMEIIYYEACLNEKDAFKRENYLKTTYGKRYLRNRLLQYFTGKTEGSSRSSDADLARFIEIAYGSLLESVSELEIAKRQQFLKDEDFTTVYNKAENLSKMLSGFR